MISSSPSWRVSSRLTDSSGHVHSEVAVSFTIPVYVSPKKPVKSRLCSRNSFSACKIPTENHPPQRGRKRRQQAKQGRSSTGTTVRHGKTKVQTPHAALVLRPVESSGLHTERRHRLVAKLQ